MKPTPSFPAALEDWWRRGRRVLCICRGLPVLAALSEDAGQPVFARFKFRFSISGFGEFGFGGDEAAFAGGFEDGGAVAFEVGLHPPQRRHPRLQPRELLLNLRHNPPLFGESGQIKLHIKQLFLCNACNRCSPADVFKYLNPEFEL